MFRHTIVLFFIFLSFPSLGEAPIPTCEAIEIIKGQEKYNNFLCDGVNFSQIGLYEKAIEAYKKAADINFLEVPNYRLNARIAHSYLLLGDLENATYYIKKSELTLLLLAGAYSCEEDEKLFFFISKDGKTPLVTPVAQEVTGTMCGGAYEYIYNPRFKNLFILELEGELAKYHLSVERLINDRLALITKK